MKIGTWTLVFALFAASANADAETLRCGSRVVSPGETKADVIAKCGEPAGTHTRDEETIVKNDAGTKTVTTVTIDEWTYNFGPDSLVRILTFRNNSLTDISAGGYGYSASPEPARCDPLPDRGATPAEVIVKCGDPTWKDERREETIMKTDSDTKQKTAVSIEVWTYNLGPDRLMRSLEFRNGRLVDVRTGNYGY